MFKKNMKSTKHIRKFPIGFKKLEEISSQEPDDIIFELLNPGSGFQLLLQENIIRDDMMCLVIEVTGKACKTRHRHSLMEFLTLIKSSLYFQKHLLKFIISVQDSVKLQDRFSNTLFEQLLSFFSAMLDCYSSTASEDLEVTMYICRQVVDSLSFFTLKSSLAQEFSQLETRRLELSNLNKPKEKLPSAKTMEEQEPPSSFREMSVVPTVADLRSDILPFVRPNVISGKYSSAEHYLDVQFRLLREDFMMPLREGLKQYLANLKTNQPIAKFQDIRVYENVRVIHPVCVSQGIAYKIQIDVEKLKNVRWEASKRLIYGSLLCLSRDNFQSALFATVVNRFIDDVKEGFIEIRFENPAVQEIPESHVFVMIETQAYFEAYRHILRSLKNFREDDLPFKNYIIEVNREIKPPSYLDNFSRYDLRPLVMKPEKKSDSDAEYESDVTIGPEALRRLSTIPVKSFTRWPTSEECKLDYSQWKAIQSALTRQLAVIQGPPGTGKTFIGLKIVQILLHNREKWASGSDPILLVCYTNHALDQFLEGIVKITSKLIRIGGRSSSEILKDYNLRSLRDKKRKDKLVPRQIHYGIHQIYKSMMACKDAILRIGKYIGSTFKGVVHEKKLEGVMTSAQWKSLQNGMFYRPGTSSIITDWLCDTQFDENFGGNFDGNFGENFDGNFGGNFDASFGGNIGAEVDNVEDDDDGGEIEIEEEGDIETRNRLLDGDEDEFDEDDDDDDRDDGENENILVVDFNEILKEFNKEEIASRDDKWQVSGIKKIIKREMRKKDAMTDDEAKNIEFVWDLNFKDRWRLYRNWLIKFRQLLNEEAHKIENNYETATRRLRELQEEEDLNILREAKVIGLTTTGTARLHSYLEALRPSIVVVEEAAEVLEAHIVTALTKHCKHLILIGDHQQLRPNPTVYELAKDYKLDVSLFERLIKNNVPYDQLELQHRMRPEIAGLLVPHIYPSLQNHASVLSYDKVRGLEKNLFFITHTVPESSVMDTQSKINEYEVRYLVELCRYLRQHDYDNSQITILTMYLGQLLLFKKYMKKNIFKGIRVTVVDNYQGEENDIILLSLVRSNLEGNIGFVKIANRICVALSRAKKGLYVIGNFQLMVQKERLWQEIIKYLEKTESVGVGLNAVCDNHPKVKTLIKTPEDFNFVREGGCNLPCEYRFDCGHQCPSVCHVTDKEHANKICQKNCTKKCPNGHLCQLKCGQKCGDCKTKIRKVMPTCHHTIEVLCHQEKKVQPCTHGCEKYLECGHRCKNLCHEACSIICFELVSVQSDCGHQVKIFCSELLNTPNWEIAMKCKVKCKTTLSCDHPCPGTCGSCLQGKIHEACKQKCERLLVCGHPCTEPCAESCPPCTRTCETRCIHSKCSYQCGKPCVPCGEPCLRSCQHVKCTNLCGDLCNVPPCNQPCKKLLKCRHPCIGLCGEPCPKKCRICDKEEVCELLFGDEEEPDARFIELQDCGHVVEVNGLDRWMKQKNEMRGQDEKIAFKFCPKCRKGVQTSWRYEDIIKSTMVKINNIKRDIFYGQGEDVEEVRQNLKFIILEDFSDYFENDVDLYRKLKHMSLTQLKVTENQLTFLTRVKKLDVEVTKLFPLGDDHQFVLKVLKFIKNRLSFDRFKFSEQESTEISWELHRISHLINLLKFSKSIGGVKNLLSQVKPKYEQARQILLDFTPFREKEETQCKTLIKEINKLQGGLGVSDEERLQIIQALNLKKTGHWYSCPNGHVYAVGDCGTPMQESNCPECRARIGGNVFLNAANRRVDDVMLRTRRN